MSITNLPQKFPVTEIRIILLTCTFRVAISEEFWQYFNETEKNIYIYRVSVGLPTCCWQNHLPNLIIGYHRHIVME